jgi:hypothetical protein
MKQNWIMIANQSDLWENGEEVYQTPGYESKGRRKEGRKRESVTESWRVEAHRPHHTLTSSDLPATLPCTSARVKLVILVCPFSRERRSSMLRRKLGLWFTASRSQVRVLMHF